MFNKLTPVLIRAAGIFILMLIVSTIIVSVSYVYMDDSYQDQQSAKRAMRKWQAKINSSVENNQIIDAFESNFIKLVDQGVVGTEDRLSWFETIQDTAKKRGMPLVKYSISAQNILQENNLKNQYRGIDVFKSVMTLDIKMAHEGDLFALLNDLEKADGLFAVDRCEIEKISKEVVDVNNNMKAYCELGWYTFKGSRAKSSRNNPG
jgi:cell division protein FtsL